MLRHKPRWLCAHILTLLMFLAIGLTHPTAQAIADKGTDVSVVPEAGGGGGNMGDPDQPQEPPKFAPGGDPEYTVYTPSETGGSRFGRGQIMGRNTANVWQWRVRVWLAGIRFGYLRF